MALPAVSDGETEGPGRIRDSYDDLRKFILEDLPNLRFRRLRLRKRTGPSPPRPLGSTMTTTPDTVNRAAELAAESSTAPTLGGGIGGSDGPRPRTARPDFEDERTS